MSEPYQRFLGSTDVAVWSTCLDELAQMVETASARGLPERAAEALTVASYLAWLARSSGDDATVERADWRVRTLFTRVRAEGEPTVPGWRRCWAVALSYGGYSASAREMVEGDRPWPIELTVLLARGSDFDLLKELRDAVSGAPETWFLPGVFVYAHALMGAGASLEAQRVVRRATWRADDPLLLDLLGTSHEGLGRWSEAFDAYRRSPWPEHRIRASLVGTIARQPPSITALQLDNASRQALISLGGELDQAELRRSAAFLNACRWQPVDSWLVEFELGRLSFRRRQFAEADAHFSRAALTAPAPARYAVALLRFTNLTWLSGRRAPAAIDRTPEAIGVADQVVRLDDSDPQTPGVLIWLARATSDFGRIPASLVGWEPYDRLDALDALGRDDEVVDEVLALLDTEFAPRAVHTLMDHLNRAGLVTGARELAAAILRESGNDLFALWETCQVLGGLDGGDIDDLEFDASGVPSSWRTKTVERFRGELQRLSRFEFMDTIRMFHVALDAERFDDAQELLARAGAQAEDVSELIEVAIQRQVFGVTDRSVLVDALGWLERARALSRDRSERLVIARELLRLGGIRAARQIFLEEKVLAVDTTLSDSEFTVALECAVLLDAEQRVQLARRAAQRLADDYDAGRLGAYPGPYARRLLNVLGQLDQQAGSQSLTSTVEDVLQPLLDKSSDSLWTGPEDPWPPVLNQLDELIAGDQSPAHIEASLDGLTVTESFGRRLRIVTYLRAMLAHLQEVLTRMRPAVPDDAIPLARWHGPDEASRVFELCDRWRERIMGTAGADTELQSFLDEEQRLQAEWDDRRLDASADVLRQVVRTATALQRGYDSLVAPDELAVKHPVLSRLYASIAEDVARSSAHAREQAAAAEQQLAQLTDEKSVEVG